MKNVQWVKFMDVFERTHADLIASYFNAHGIETQVIQEAYFQYEIGVSAAGQVQILVPNFQLEEARTLYAESGWNFDTADNADDEEEKE